jgi:hypothetical protein
LNKGIGGNDQFKPFANLELRAIITDTDANMISSPITRMGEIGFDHIELRMAHDHLD